jgi:DNA-binding MarR family transcriptional regulator
LWGERHSSQQSSTTQGILASNHQISLVGKRLDSQHGLLVYSNIFDAEPRRTPAEIGAQERNMASTEAPDPFAALASPIRRRILELVSEKACSAGDIADAMPVGRSAVSQHLKLLREAGLVRETCSGRHVIYRAEPGALSAIGRYLAGLESGSRSCDADSATDPGDQIFDANRAWALDLGIDPVFVALVSRLLLVAKIMETMMAGLARRYGLNSGEVMLLGTLRRLGEPHRATPTELARHSILAPPGVAKRLGRLEREGLVSREESGTDRRSHHVVLTPAGRVLADRFARENLTDNYAVLQRLPTNDRNQLARILREILPHLGATGFRRTANGMDER